MTGDRRRGAALFVVLLFSAFLAALAGAAMRTSLSGVRAAAAFADAMRADELGRGAADALAYRLATGGADAKRGGAIAVRLPGGDITVDYLSESARIDANLAPVALIGGLLAAAGADQTEVDAAVARIVAFRAAAAARAGADGVTSTGEGVPPPLGGLAAIQASVDALGPAAKPKPASQPLAIRDPTEVGRAWGLSDALVRRVLPALTVSSAAAKVDPVLAGRLVVLALLGGDERTDDYLRRRRQGFVDADSALALIPVPMRDVVAFTDSSAVRAVARVRLANRFERRYEMILAPPPRAEPGQGTATPAGGGASPGTRLVVVSWRRMP